VKNVERITHWTYSQCYNFCTTKNSLINANDKAAGSKIKRNRLSHDYEGDM